jgi:hypothetical protein
MLDIRVPQVITTRLRTGIVDGVIEWSALANRPSKQSGRHPLGAGLPHCKHRVASWCVVGTKEGSTARTVAAVLDTSFFEKGHFHAERVARSARSLSKHGVQPCVPQQQIVFE